MRHYVAKICLLLALTGLGISEWVEIAQSRPQDNHTASFSRAHVKQLAAEVAAKMYGESPSDSDFTTPSAEWIEYQRERFGLSSSQSHGLVVSSSLGSLKHSSQVVVPAKVQLIKATTKLLVKSTGAAPAVVELLVTPKVETTSRRLADEQPEGIVETITEPPADSSNNNDSAELFPSMGGFLQFLKSMQSSWIKKSKLSIEKKIKLLKQLRDNLMKVIEQQFSVLWQPTERQFRNRKRRGLLDESNLDFPPEAALMSINFLTFAVFLIKLVLQVVQIVKSKHYSFAGFNINTEVTRNP